MRKVLNLSVGEMAVGKDNVIIRTVGIGSCIVVGVFDKEEGVGGMLHSMLPGGDSGPEAEVIKCSSSNIRKYRAKYISESIELMVKKMIKRGAKVENMIAKMTGGANMLKSFNKEASVGERNLQMARQKLKDLGIRVKGEDTGGDVGRMADFNLSNGILSINIKI